MWHKIFYLFGVLSSLFFRPNLVFSPKTRLSSIIWPILRLYLARPLHLITFYTRPTNRRYFMAQQHTEHTEQSKLITYIRHPQTAHQWPRLKEIFAIPNGAFMSKREAAKLSREGVRSGPVDLCLPIRSYTGRFPILWIEFKRPDGKGRVSDTQTEFMEHREAEGHKTVVVYSAVEAVRKVLAYAYGLDINTTQAKELLNRALTCP